MSLLFSFGQYQGNEQDQDNQARQHQAEQKRFDHQFTVSFVFIQIVIVASAVHAVPCAGCKTTTILRV